MLPLDIHRNVQIERDAGFQQQLKSGDFVYISVLKKLAPHKWAIGIHGKTVPAYSLLELKPGDIIKARAQLEGTKINLHLLSDEKTLLQEKLSGQGIRNDPLSLVIISSLIKGGLPLEAHSINRIRSLLNKLKKQDRHLITLLVHLLKKGISLESLHIAELVSVLNYGEQKKEDRQKHKERREPVVTQDIKQALKDTITKTGLNNDNILPLFNHLYAEGENWIILPFHYTLDGSDLEGTVRMLYDSYTRKIVKFTVIVQRGEGTRWSFFINAAASPLNMKIYCNNKMSIKKAKQGLNELAAKLDNNNIKIDDTIDEEENIDGFSPVDEINYYKSINKLQ